MKPKRIALIALILTTLSLTGCNSSDNDDDKDKKSDKVSTYQACVDKNGQTNTEKYPEECEYDGKNFINKKQELKKEPMEKHYVKVETSKGDFELELDGDKAPVTVSNFLNYVNNKFYDGTVFHRIMADFMIQGGGFTEIDGKEKTMKDPIENEADNGLKNKAYTIAMARTTEIHSATSQFFINTVDNDILDFTAKTYEGYGYAVFGKVISGQETIDKIKETPVETNAMGEASTPLEVVTIEKMYEVEK